MKRIIIQLLLLQIVCSCNNKIDASYTVYESDTVWHIDLNPFLENVLLDEREILDSQRFVCLETNDESLVSSVSGIVISDDRIFINDNYLNGGVVIFDTAGKFINRIPHGNGPGEISRVINMGYDKRREKLLVLGNSLMSFDKNGNYQESKYMDFPCDRVVAFCKNSYIFSKVYGHPSAYSELDNYSLIVTDTLFRVKQLLLPYNSCQEKLSAPNVATERLGGYCISPPFADTIYCFRNDSLFPLITLDYSSKRLNAEQFSSLEEYIENVIITKKTKGFRFEGNYLENSTHQFIGLMEGNSECLIFRDKSTNNVVSGTAVVNDPNLAVSISGPVGVSGDWFYEVQNAQNFNHNTITSNRYISKEDLADLENLKPDSNPFIVFYKLKDF